MRWQKIEIKYKKGYWINNRVMFREDSREKDYNINGIILKNLLEFVFVLQFFDFKD